MAPDPKPDLKQELQAQQQQVQIEIDDATARGNYSNIAFISHSETEFVIDFTMLQPQAPKAKVVTRVITSPGHMKRLIAAMQENLQRYEARFGAVRAQDQKAEPKGIYH